MAVQGTCWVCAGRAEALIALRPEGSRDGRAICRGCGQRFVEHLRRRRMQGGPLLDPAIFQPAEPATGLFFERVREALSVEDELARTNVAIACLEMGLREDGLQALSTVAPEALHGFTERVLTSLLSRLFHPEALQLDAIGALREAVRGG